MTIEAPFPETTVLSETAVQTFQASLRGELIRPDDEGYEVARGVFNVMIDRRPALIVRCAGVADVINAVTFARSNGLLVAVRGAGHHVAGHAVCEGGMVIDLSRMKGLRIDPEARRAWVEPGVTWGELNHDLQVFGLGATGGYVSITGIPGLTLGGGLGWLVRKHGLALDNLLSVDLVTADGKLLKASARENADLFWGLRGGGGNFGIVTSFEFQIHPVGLALAGIVIHPIERAKEVLQLFRQHVHSAPDELTWGALLFSVPPSPEFPPPMHGVPVIALAVCYAGPLDDGERVLRPIRQFGPPLADIVQPMPYSAVQTMADVLWQRGHHNYWKSNFLKDLSDDAMDTLLAHFAQVPSPRTVMVVDHNGGGAISRVPRDETAYGHREWTYNLLVTSAWAQREETDLNIRWTRELWDAMQPYLAGAVYVNYTSDLGDELLKDAYPAQIRERLVALKSKYDPTNFFRLNQNVRPTV